MKKISQTVCTLAFILFAISTAHAGQVHLEGGDVITLQPNSTTTVTCGGGANSEPQVVARNCFCGDTIVNDKWQIIMRLVYSNGSHKDVVAKELSANWVNGGDRDDCNAAAEKTCR